MSYIDEALKKAQRDRDSRYKRFGSIIASEPAGRRKSGNRKQLIGAAIALLVLIPAGLLMALYFLQPPSPVVKGLPPPVVSEDAGEKPAAVPAERETAVVPEVERGAATPAKKAGIPEGGTPAAVRADGKPLPDTATVPPDGLPNRREAEIRYLEALAAQRRGDQKRAEELYQQAITLDPGHVRAMNNLGVLFVGQKKKGQAIGLFNRAIGQKTDYVDPYYNLACLYALAGEIDDSLRYLRLAIAINGDVKNWAEKDADMRNVVTSEAYRKIMERQKQ